MKRIGLVLGLTVAAIACATGADMVGEMMDSGVPDAGAQPTPAPIAKFVGYTGDGYRLSPGNGEGGLFKTYAACQADFGAAARICTIAEVLGTVDLPAPPPESDGVSTAAGAWMVETLGSTPSCWGTGTSRNAPYLTPEGRVIGNDGCTSPRVLACCTVN